MTLIEATQKSKVLITGANGYFALWIVYDLLDSGFSVRGTVRSEEKGKWLTAKFASYGKRFEWIVVEDITKDDAFDEAVKDVVAIMHVASPLSPGGTDPDLLIKPAVQGTVGILTSALNHGKEVKRIVITSSCGAIGEDRQDPVQVFDESNWGDDYVQQVREQGKDAPFMSKYKASKTLAERAAWTFYEENKGKVGWDMVVLHPPFILGGSHLEIKKPENLTSSLQGLYYNAFNTERARNARNGYLSYVHVKDASRLHIQALNTPAAAGQRIILSAGSSTWGQAGELIRKLYPELVRDGFLPTLPPDDASGEVQPGGKVDYPAVTSKVDYRNDKSIAIFGIEYRGFEECIQDSMEYFKERGFFDAKSD
ncbi:D-lactaldehyde dehydrogenase [Panaeolus papilionaceus]|nr:D-lactaldehyde dehydrogenase [Panaeolus papilionaceus]